MQAACLPPASLAQLMREAALREEWRGQREAALLHSLGPQSLAGLLGLGSGPGGSADGRMLADQVAALTEVRLFGVGYTVLMARLPHRIREVVLCAAVCAPSLFGARRPGAPAEHWVPARGDTGSCG